MESFEIGEAPSDYATDIPHAGWRATITFWADMYKEETAKVTEETLKIPLQVLTLSLVFVYKRGKRWQGPVTTATPGTPLGCPTLLFS
jgi:hypothetical protein